MAPAPPAGRTRAIAMVRDGELVRRVVGSAILVMLVAACGPRAPASGPIGDHAGPPANLAPDAAAPPRGDVPCGDATCGPDQYCEHACLCCGMRLPTPAEARGQQSCQPLPDACRTANGPECQQRVVHLPCA